MSAMQSAESWGRNPRAREQALLALHWPDEPLPQRGGPLLPYGLGRSYGDSCLNEGGTLLLTRGLNRFQAFDAQTGLLRVEAGVTLEEILKFAVPRGWFLPTTPGTKFVTVGGALANDVHGKNHHRAGTIGCHVPRFELLRSDGSRRVCSAREHGELYRATIGGLGLTGLITWAELRLVRASGWIDNENIRFGRLDDFFALNADSESRYEHTVAWIDCMAQGAALGRGIYMRGNTLPPGPEREARVHAEAKLRFPVEAPGWLLSGPTVRAFNVLYYWKQLRRASRKVVHYEPFFYPLDAVHDWNRVYGRRGFFQYQFVVPAAQGVEATREALRQIAKSGQASFLAVLKTFGRPASPGLLSFPRPGITLALDFPNNGAVTQALFERLDGIVREAGGVLYPAKDARMRPEDFQSFYPQWRELEALRDPAFSSSLWRRLTAR